MMGSVKSLDGFTIAASDGDVGTVEDVYFDDEKWTIRHLVVDTGGWLGGRKVLLSPRSVTAVNFDDQIIRVALTRQKIEDSPSVDTDRPVSRQEEYGLDDYYGFPSYWGGPMLWGFAATPLAMAPPPVESTVEQEMRAREEQERDHHLRSSDAVIGYDIETTDGTIGHVEDFLFDDSDWSIRMMAVDTRNWWPGKHVLISPQRIDSVSWNDKKVVVKLTRDEVEKSPEYDAERSTAFAARADVYRPFEHYP
jgi:uncharacterized protein YrrD